MFNRAARLDVESLEDRCVPATMSLGLGTLLAQVDLAPGLHLGSLVRTQETPRNESAPARLQVASFPTDAVRIVSIQIFITQQPVKIDASADVGRAVVSSIRTNAAVTPTVLSEAAALSDVPRLTPDSVLASIRDLGAPNALLPIPPAAVVGVATAPISSQPGGEATLFPVSATGPEILQPAPAGSLIPFSPRGAAVETAPGDLGGVVIPLPGGAATTSEEETSAPSEQTVTPMALDTNAGPTRLWAWVVLAAGTLAALGELARRYWQSRPKTAIVSLRPEENRD